MRALRRIQKKQKQQTSEDGNEAEAETKGVDGRPNAFEMLDDNEESEHSETEQKRESSDEEQRTIKVNKRQVNKQRKKQRKANSRAEREEIEKLARALEQSESSGEEPERELAKEPTPISSSSQNLEVIAPNSLFYVMSLYFDPSKELHQVVNKTLVNKPKHGMSVSSVVSAQSRRVGILVEPLQHWPNSSLCKAITMEMLKKNSQTPSKTKTKANDKTKTKQETEKADDEDYFYYVGNRKYTHAHKLFIDAFKENDPGYYKEVFKVFPYHPDALIQMALLSKLTGENPVYEELLQRCIYCYQCGFHHNFRLNGRCRLLFSDSVTKPFFYALFRYMQLLNKRGCPRTALEFCKLLISFDLDDPTGAFLLIDYYALRSTEYEYMLKLFLFGELRSIPLMVLPNISYSAAFAKFMIEGNISNNNPDPFPTYEANKLLQSAILLFPNVIPQLALVLNDQKLTLLAQHEFFEQNQAENDILDKVTKIYVEHSKALWKLPPFLKNRNKKANKEKETEVNECPIIRMSPLDWLITQTEFITEHIQSDRMLFEEHLNGRCIRHERFPIQDPQTGKYETDELIFRDVIPADFSDETDAISRELLQQNRELPVEEHPALTDNPLELFITSMFPWLQVPDEQFAEETQEREDPHEREKND